MAAGASTHLLSVRGDDPQLSLRANAADQAGGADSLGMRLELPPDEIGKTRFELGTKSQDGGAPQFDSLVVDQRLALPRLDDLLPGKLDLGVRASRQREVAAWDLAFKPKFRIERDGLAFKADVSLGRLADADNSDLAARYSLSTSYALNHSLSFGLDGQGEVRRNGVRPQAGFDQMTPQLSGRYFIRDGFALRYRMGWDINLASGERSPDLELKFDLRF